MLTEAFFWYSIGMNNADELRKTYNTIAVDYTKNHLDDTWDDDYCESFINLLVKGSEVLDLGCGPGTDSKTLIQHGLAVTGIDLSDELIRIARENNPQGEFLQGNMLDLPFDDEKFDGLFAKASLLHLKQVNVPKALQEIVRVVKPGAIVHIAIKGGDGERIVKEDKFGYEFERFFCFWDSGEFAALLEEAGLTILKNDSKYIGNTNWLQYLAQS
jgi:ubiquinone/menaquinone biosynthesis C-methylase UbiE